MSEPILTTASLAALQMDAANLNRGTERGRAMVRQSLDRLGAGRSIVLDARGQVIAGNKTLEAARELGMERLLVVETEGETLVAVKRRDLDLAQGGKARELSLADNRSSEVGLEWDAAAIAAQLEGGLDLSAYFSGEELQDLLASLAAPGGLVAGADPDALPVAVPSRCHPGDLWECGRHRLLCGDSTRPEDLARLLDGEAADLCITSPPYNLGSDHHTDRKRTQAYPDEVPEEVYQAGQVALLELLRDFVRGDCFYQHKNRIKGGRWVTPVSWLDRGSWRLVQEVVWINGGPNMDPCRFYPQTERVYWLTHEGSMTRLNNVEHLTDWWHIPPVGSAGVHTRAFPVELPRRLLTATAAAAVIDPYAGSGTTLMAAQLTGARAFLCEQQPHYCDIALARFEQTTGLAPRRLPSKTLSDPSLSR